MSTNLLTQHSLRQHAVQALFMLEARQTDAITVEAAIAYSLDGAAIDNPDYLYQLVTGVWQDKKTLDTEITRFLTTNWTLSRLTIIEKTILRLGIYEIRENKTPDVVAIDEALNLTHDFSDKAAVALVNGILTHFIKE